MWVPEKFRSWFEVSKEAVESQREELAAVRADRDALKLQLAVSQNNFDWLRLRVNTLEVERAQLIQKAYGFSTPIPEVVRSPVNPVDLNADLFSDMGEKSAKEHGFPTYDTN
jgi:hypothetical protein